MAFSNFSNHGTNNLQTELLKNSSKSLCAGWIASLKSFLPYWSDKIFVCNDRLLIFWASVTLTLFSFLCSAACGTIDAVCKMGRAHACPSGPKLATVACLCLTNPKTALYASTATRVQHCKYHIADTGKMRILTSAALIWARNEFRKSQNNSRFPS